MKLEYIVSQRTNGANPFRIWDELKRFESDDLRARLVQLDYSAFLNTAYWFSVSSVCKARAKMRCQVCNSSSELAVHHRTYESHGAEHLFMEDLVCLCGHCHGLFHGKLPPLPRKEHVVQVIQVVTKAEPAPKKERHEGDPWADTVLVTAQNCGRLRCTKEPWHWMLRQGINPRVKGWAKRAVGRYVPRGWMRGA